jgi:hypothetical protein
MTGDHAPGPSTPDARRRALGLSTFDLWVRCLSLGGDLTLARLRVLLSAEEAALTHGDRSVIAQALDEAAMDQGPRG